MPEGPPYPIRAVVDEEWHFIRNLMPDRLYFEKHMMGGFRANWFWESWLAATGPWIDSPINRRAVELVNRFMRRPSEQLYNVESDPYQMKNLARDPNLAPVRDRMRAALGRWMLTQGDPGAALDSEVQWRAARSGRPLSAYRAP